MRKFLFLLTLLLSLGSSALWAESGDTDISALANTPYSQPRDVKAAEQVTLSLAIKNEMIISGFQLDVELPQGFSFVKDGRYYVADLSTERDVSSRTHTFSTQLQDDGSLRILCYSGRNYPFNGNDGEVATLAIDVAATAPMGPSPILLKNIVLTDDQGKTIKPTEVTFSLTVTDVAMPEELDLSGDGDVTKEDVSLLVNDILSPSCHFSVADIIRLINYLLRHPAQQE